MDQAQHDKAAFLKRPLMQKAVASERSVEVGAGEAGLIHVTHRSPFTSLSHRNSDCLRVWAWANSPLLPASPGMQIKLGNVNKSVLRHILLIAKS